MNRDQGLDISALAQFRASDLLDRAGLAPDPGAAVHVALSLIDLDAKQPRRQFSEQALEELGGSIRLHGILEPISVRRHPDVPGRFIVNRGERRVRAARLCGLTTVPVFVDERIDPFAQAAENLHREDMSPLDLALFIAEREQEGIGRSEIARRLGKQPSFITEVATLNTAPAALLEAVRAGHVHEDTRMLYRLVAVAREEPHVVEALLRQPERISRTNVEDLLAQARSSVKSADGRESMRSVTAAKSGGRTVLIVEHEGRRGALRIKARDDDCGEVRFGDGSRGMLPLAALKPVCWATEGSK